MAIFESHEIDNSFEITQNIQSFPMKKILLTSLLLSAVGVMNADDGHGLWLNQLSGQKAEVSVKTQSSPSVEVARQELHNSWKGGAVTLSKIASDEKNSESFMIEIKDGKPTIAAKSDMGLLYGAYHLLRLQNTGANVKDTILAEAPAFDLRILNHWDNLDASCERGYAGQSIFWAEYEGKEQRIKDYARANASIGINASVLDNVNASVKILNTDYLQKIKGIADIMRPYGVRVYLAVNFASPVLKSHLRYDKDAKNNRPDLIDTADPLDPRVQEWWKNKCNEIYSLIPDFGGFLVKANSEGQPGPNDYNRTHAEGANMLARALKPHGGIVMWRSFVYAANDPDRAKLAYAEFKPFDGQFDDNVIIQIKNGPVDFQPREPYTSLFGAMDKTKEMVEFQVTQEYLGHSNHIAYLGTMWEEFYEYVKPSTLVAASGVANIGLDTNWCGNVMAQSNWYVFGRQCWNPSISAETIAKEWTKQTLAPKTAEAEKAIVDMMMRSREAIVDYMMPMGLHHQFADNHHYGPGAWISHKNLRLDWQPPYYHKADAQGLGFDRTSKTGTNAVAQYPADFANIIDNIETCPEKFLLWFHHVPWNYPVAGEPMWNRLCHHYQNGVNEVRKMQAEWNSVKDAVDSEIFDAIAYKLSVQLKDAIWWKDGMLEYFKTLSNMPYPADVEPAQHKLEDLKKVLLPYGICGNVQPEELDKWR